MTEAEDAISLLDVALADVTDVDNGTDDSSLLDGAWIIVTIPT